MGDATFSGLEPWTDNFPRIEFVTASGVVDLYNNAVFDELILRPAGPSIVLAFRYAENWREIESAGRHVELEFGGVSGLEIRQAADYDARAAATLQGVVHDAAGEESRFTVDLGDLV